MNHKIISLTVDCIIFSKDTEKINVLLIKRKYPPFKNCWALPGGFVEVDETLDSAARRELKEETGLEIMDLKQLYTFGDLDRDPRGRTVSVVYYGFADKSGMNAVASDDAKEAKWFDIENLPSLAFDHEGILEYALKNIDEIKSV